MSTAMGLDVKALPEPPSERERGEDQRSRHVRQGSRRIAVASFNGVPQVGRLGWRVVRCQRVPVSSINMVCISYLPPSPPPQLVLAGTAVFSSSSFFPFFVSFDSPPPTDLEVSTLRTCVLVVRRARRSFRFFYPRIVSRPFTTVRTAGGFVGVGNSAPLRCFKFVDFGFARPMFCTWSEDVG